MSIKEEIAEIENFIIMKERIQKQLEEIRSSIAMELTLEGAVVPNTEVKGFSNPSHLKYLKYLSKPQKLSEGFMFMRLNTFHINSQIFQVSRLKHISLARKNRLAISFGPVVYVQLESQRKQIKVFEAISHLLSQKT